MAQPIRPHGVGTRGINLSRSSVLFGGPFGRMFRALPPADFGNTEADSQKALKLLGDSMCAKVDPPADRPDGEESGIPAAYTYFGQFVDHDLTFDPASSLQRTNDPDALVDYRTPRFDLDNVYGKGPDDQPYLYADGRHFNVAGPLTGKALGKDLTANALPRSSAKPARAIIGDPRNDENVIISQLQGLFLRFHNKLIDLNPDWSFAEVQQKVRFHYQWIVLNDFLPKIVAAAVLKEVVPHLSKHTNIVKDKPKLEFFHYKNEPFMPLEFSVAAYRLGHSMVRPGYRLNDDVGPLPIFPFKGDNGKPGLTGFREFPANWSIDWGRFIDLEPRPYGDENDDKNPGNLTRTQLAYRIDTSAVNALGALPDNVAPDLPRNLAERNLLRAWRLRLPSGQNVARAMGVKPLADKDILIGKFTGDANDIKGSIIDPAVGGMIFADNCPLWTYVLAETIEDVVSFATTDGKKQIKTRRLGLVGGRIVAETFVGLLLGDSSSYLAQDPLWTPDPSLMENGHFGLREFIKFASA